MKSTKLKFNDFELEQLTKEQQKAVRGGDGDTDPKNGGGGSGNTVNYIVKK
ncbi:rSAM-modified peptide [Flavobacterium hungaricum]|uniref:RSAM-modified peptide n=1 Tax=Flavobacterium hungaricum TaxID=2082725 RepID=A0ABR9TIP5_9FLAO|nr:rSAM-modified peptide [Flavobacterium hungaricum]MBE8725140.1 rSAM-modified peptide [Flavobacterium hungaricum]